MAHIVLNMHFNNITGIVQAVVASDCHSDYRGGYSRYAVSVLSTGHNQGRFDDAQLLSHFHLVPCM